MFEHYPKYEYPLAQIQLVLFMLGMGATLSWRDFAPVFRMPRDLLLGLLLVLLVSPLIALGIAKVTGLSPGVSLGLLLVATLPGGTFSNVFTYVGKGNVALSIAMSACGAFVALLTLPLMLGWLASSYVPAGFRMPILKIVVEIILCVILPVLVGMWLGHRLGERKKALVRWCMRLGFLLIIVMVIGSFGSKRIVLQDYSFWVPVTIILYSVLAQQLCSLPIRLLRWPTETFLAVAMEVTVRNVYLGILITAVLGQSLKQAGMGAGLADDVLFVVLFYGAAMLFVGFPVAYRVRRVFQRQERASQQEPTPSGVVSGTASLQSEPIA